jgi:hypothetical protein
MNNKMVIPFVEEKLRVKNYLLKAQSNPLKTISFAAILKDE